MANGCAKIDRSFLLSNRRLGARGEAIAVRHLEGKGYQIRDRNWHAASGELDLVAQDGDTVVVVEVKTRSGRAYGLPEEAVTQGKRRRLLRTAWAYMEQKGLLESDWRIDVIAIEVAPWGSIRRVDHYQNIVDDDPEARK
jgi:putative endonuclease